MSAERWRSAFGRFVDALNRPRDPAALAAAVADDIRLDRYAPAARDALAIGGPDAARAAGQIVEAFAGIAEVAAWFARMPPAIRFAVAGAPWPASVDAGSCWGVEYTIDADGFHNGGIWLAELADDDRVARLAHRPFALATG